MNRFALASVILLITPLVNAQQLENVTVVVDFYYSNTCPHCAEEKPFLEGLMSEFPWLEVRQFEVSEDRDNAFLFAEKIEECGGGASSVPGTLVCDRLYIGYIDDSISGNIIRDSILECHERLEKGENITGCTIADAGKVNVEIPFIGEVEVSQLSLPLFTVVLGGLDGFNPCAFFVLFFLLSLLIHAKSRRRMLLIGLIFVFFSGLIYFIFMSAWLNFFLLMKEIRLITTLAGVVAITVAVFNIKDAFWFRQGPSLSIPESAKPKLFKRMRALVKATELQSMILGTIVLAVAANTYELLCTAGLPMVYTRVLTLSGLSSLENYMYLALYNLVYVMPLLTIVLVFTLTLGSRKLGEGEGRMLKLMSGFMMLALGLILAFIPELLNDLVTSVGIVITAVGVSVILMPFTRDRS
ncbi:MAG: hypothetical protein GF416_08830 [Candidatus Altiarchaeales archaeon]|nr:hypothetical protein [Candidatus Altiarchaeales archaeon]MBD3417221.1 hypothetical protein [Candidatus Altiarchaeales archaeon]